VRTPTAPQPFGIISINVGLPLLTSPEGTVQATCWPTKPESLECHLPPGLLSSPLSAALTCAYLCCSGAAGALWP
jgi:hypothetical protein